MMTFRRRLVRLFLIAVGVYLVFLFLFTTFEGAPSSPLTGLLPHQRPPSSSSSSSSSKRPAAAAAAASKPKKNKNGGDDTNSQSSRPKITFKPSSFDWTAVKPHNPIPSSTRRVFSKAIPHPSKIQHESFKNYVHSDVASSRQQAIKRAFEKSWSSYVQHAFGYDELAPVSGQPKTTFGGWAATLIDALDTLYIMNFTSSSSSLSDDDSSTPNLSFEHAANFASQLDFSKTKDTSCNLFETTIRHLGGLVSAYDLSLEPALLQKAKELGDMLLLSFDTPNGIPPFWFDFRKAKTGHLVAGNNDPSAAMGSLALEFTRLSQLTGDAKYREKVERVTDFFERVQEESRVPGIWPKMIDFQHEAVKEEGGFTLGALADSLYEYLIKMVALVGNESEEGKRYERMYKRASEVLRKEMVFRPMVPDEPKKGGGGGLLFVGDLYVNSKGEKEKVFEGQHLTCFGGGMFALGGRMLGRKGDVLVGEQLARGCGWAYGAFESGIMPEIFGLVGCGHGGDDDNIDSECKWDEEKWKKENKDASGKLPKGFTKVQDSRYILRPEAIESVFVLYRITGKEELRDLAWRMWEGIRKNTETELAFSAVRDVTVVGKEGEGEETKNKLDSMESFWLAETLKYFYLIFSPPDVISLDDYVFNTEAHPFRRPK